MFDKGQYNRALPLADKVVRGAEEEQHHPVAWWARGLRSALRSRLGLGDSPQQPPDRLTRGNIPLALATAWYLAAAYEGQDAATAETLREEGLELARSTGFADWLTRFEQSDAPLSG
jgi:hypothetical protein